MPAARRRLLPVGVRVVQYERCAYCAFKCGCHVAAACRARRNEAKPKRNRAPRRRLATSGPQPLDELHGLDRRLQRKLLQVDAAAAVGVEHVQGLPGGRAVAREAHVVVEVPLKFISGKPTIFMKSVVIEPDPLIWIVSSVLDVPGV